MVGESRSLVGLTGVPAGNGRVVIGKFLAAWSDQHHDCFDFSSTLIYAFWSVDNPVFFQKFQDDMKEGKRMAEKNLSEHRLSACWVALAFLVVGLIVLSPLVFAQVEKSPVATPKTSTPKATVPSPEKVVTPSTKLAPGEKVNINTATKEKLGALPEIGPAKSQAIIDGRPYAKPEDIMKVKGIKKGTYDKIKDLITVQ